jgi:hypothetical protein
MPSKPSAPRKSQNALNSNKSGLSPKKESRVARALFDFPQLGIAEFYKAHFPAEWNEFNDGTKKAVSCLLRWKRSCE